jgi:serine/threonine protein kinase
MATLFQRLGPYAITQQIGRGGMADVYLATDTRTGRPVALKVVSRATAPEQQDIVRAEQQGADLQQRFSQASTFVPAVFEHGEDADCFYVAMEYLEGENLSALISKGMPVERAVSIASDLCRFVEDADAFEATLDGKRVHSLIHGDLTPGNVRILPDGNVKILDFGIAKALSLSRKVTRNDFGNLAYLSPERLDTNEVDRYTDFWAVGVLLYEMVRGERPFVEPDTRRLERRILAKRSPPSLDGHCSISVQAVIFKLLAPAVGDRYESASDIREDLERAVAGVPTRAEQEGWPNGGGSEPETRRTTVEDAEPTRRTLPPGLAPPPLSGPGSVSTSAPAINPPAGPSARARLTVVLLLLFAGVSGNEMWVAAQAGRVARTVPVQELEALPDVWDRYDRLARRSYLNVATGGLRRSLVAQSSELADRVIADYRGSRPSVREAQWRTARAALARAAAVSPDNAVRAAMRYCEGHLHRIDGEADLLRHRTTDARHEFTEAVLAFRDAAELRSDWPDPFLGLARTFIYGLDDVDRGADALKQAERLGYTTGDRETAQLADGYRTRGDTLSRNARQLRALPQERDLLTRSAEAYGQALALYLKVIAFGDAPRYVRSTQRELDLVEQRLHDVSPIGASNAPGAGAP